MGKRLGRFPPANQPCSNFIISGRGDLIVGDFLGHFQPGDLIIQGPNLPHSYRSRQGGPAVACYAQFREDTFGPFFWDLSECRRIRGLPRKAQRGLRFSPRSAKRLGARLNALFHTGGGRPYHGPSDPPRQCRPGYSGPPPGDRWPHPGATVEDLRQGGERSTGHRPELERTAPTRRHRQGREDAPAKPQPFLPTAASPELSGHVDREAARRGRPPVARKRRWSGRDRLRLRFQ